MLIINILGCFEINCRFFIQTAFSILLTACEYIFFFCQLLAVTFRLLQKKSDRNFVYICLFDANFNMEPTEEHSRHILLYYFPKGKNAKQVAKKLCDLYGYKALKEDSAKMGLSNFVLEIFHLKMSHVHVRQVMSMKPNRIGSSCNCP